MACQLQTRGESVALLASLDSHPIAAAADLSDGAQLLGPILNFFGYDPGPGSTPGEILAVFRQDGNPLSGLDELMNCYTGQLNAPDIGVDRARRHVSWRPAPRVVPVLRRSAAQRIRAR